MRAGVKATGELGGLLDYSNRPKLSYGQSLLAWRVTRFGQV